MNRWDIAKNNQPILSDRLPIYRELFVKFGQESRITLANRNEVFDKIALRVYESELLSYRLRELNHRVFIENGGRLSDNIVV